MNALRSSYGLLSLDYLMYPINNDWMNELHSRRSKCFKCCSCLKEKPLISCLYQFHYKYNIGCPNQTSKNRISYVYHKNRNTVQRYKAFCSSKIQDVTCHFDWIFNTTSWNYKFCSLDWPFDFTKNNNKRSKRTFSRFASKYGPTMSRWLRTVPETQSVDA